MWESRAKYVELVFGAYVNWEERFYVCPECGEPVFECDWDVNDLCDAICPICGFDDKDGAEE